MESLELAAVAASVSSQAEHATRYWGPSQRHAHLRRQSLRGDSGRWLLDNPQFTEWAAGGGESSAFWLRGAPGSGKSVLCSQVVDHIESKWSADASTAILYFYFDHRGVERMTTDTWFLLSMIAQLRRQVQPALESPEPDPSQRIEESPSFEILVRVLVFLLKQEPVKRTFIVVDALDECRNGSRRLLASLCNGVKNINNVRLFLSSRFDIQIGSQLRTLGSTLHTVDIEHGNVSDIEHFVKATLYAETLWSSELKERVARVVLARSNGGFLYARLALEALQEAITVRDLPKIVDRLPASLYKVYEEVWNRETGNENRSVLNSKRRVLRWVTCSARPLRIEELSEVFAMDLESDQIISPDQRLLQPQTLSRLLSPLLEERCFETDGTTITSLVPAHYSVKDWVECRTQSDGLNSEISQACIRYVRMLAQNDDATHTPDVEDRYPLASYAARFWWHHMQRAVHAGESITMLENLALECLQDSRGRFLQEWARWFDPDRPWIKGPDFQRRLTDMATPMYYASTLGVTVLLRKLLEDGTQDVNRVCGIHGTALQAAAYHGHEDTARLLVEHGADPFIRGGLHGTAWKAAQFVGNFKILDLFREESRRSTAEPLSIIDHEMELPRHILLDRNDQDPYEFQRDLGQGGKAYVDQVWSLAGGFVCARKTLFNFVTSLEERRNFENEVLTMERLRHVHIIKVLGSYTTEMRRFHILMEPVADCNLSQYLESGKADSALLRRWLGCIANGLAYIHQQQVKHKDIKASNLLVHGQNILYTDFGLAHVVRSLDDVTSGPTSSSHPYSAPEVLTQSNRTLATDIFSLGCVYTEMLTVMAGKQILQMKSALGGSGYNFRGPPAVEWLSELPHKDESQAEVIKTIKRMLSLAPSDRPSAAGLRQRVGSLGCSECQVGARHESTP